MKQPEPVIFDCDGVLLDSEPVGHCVVAESRSSYGLAIASEEVAALAPGGTIVQVAQATKAKGAILPASELFTRFRKEFAAIDGAHDLLDVLDKAGIRKAIDPNGPMKKMEITLGSTGPLQRFGGAIETGYASPRNPALQCCCTCAPWPEWRQAEPSLSTTCLLTAWQPNARARVSWDMR